MTVYVCSSCGVTNKATNDLTGMRHTRTAGRPSGCPGYFVLAGEEVLRLETA